jgi:hypothetical protein
MRIIGPTIGRRLAYTGLLLATLVALGTFVSGTVSAVGSAQNPQDGSIGLEGTIKAPPPTQGGTIGTPGNGQTVTNGVITVSGLCKTGLLVKIFDNNIFVGSVMCVNSSYSLQVSLFSGRNDLVARVYDALDQAGPDSNLITVTFNDAQFAQFGTRVALTSTFAKLGADPGKELDWPITLTGGVGPYAISIDWGDGTPPVLLSEAYPGDITIKHVYNSAGVYNIVVKATDANGTIAFLQLVGVANGKVSQGANGTSTANSSSGSTNTGTSTPKTSVLWWPALILLPLIIISFWLGRRHELTTLRRRLEQNRDFS